MILSIFSDVFLPAVILAVTGAVFGVLIALAAKYFAVEIDKRVEDIFAMLPGYNCGMCGHPGCEAFANALVFDNADSKLCKPGKQDMRDKIKVYFEEYAKNNQN